MWCLPGPVVTCRSCLAFVSSVLYSLTELMTLMVIKFYFICSLICESPHFAKPLRNESSIEDPQDYFEKMWETACVITLSFPPPELWGEHLCYTLSISTSLAPILVGCELVFRKKSQQCHLVTLSRILELHRVGMKMQRARFLGLSGVWTDLLLGDFLFFEPVVQWHAAIHAVLGAQGDPYSVSLCVIWWLH